MREIVCVWGLTAAPPDDGWEWWGRTHTGFAKYAVDSLREGKDVVVAVQFNAAYTILMSVRYMNIASTPPPKLTCYAQVESPCTLQELTRIESELNKIAAESLIIPIELYVWYKTAPPRVLITRVAEEDEDEEDDYDDDDEWADDGN